MVAVTVPDAEALALSVAVPAPALTVAMVAPAGMPVPEIGMPGLSVPPVNEIAVEALVVVTESVDVGGDPAVPSTMTTAAVRAYR